MPSAIEKKIHYRLSLLYGKEQATSISTRLQSLMEAYSQKIKPLEGKKLSEKDIVLITYADQLRNPGEAPLRTLGNFLTHYLTDLISIAHILPFYPFSSDDGFSVIDYRKVNPDFGTWDDVAHIETRFKLMFDAVINHISSKSEWVKHFLAGDPDYRDFFIEVDPNSDLSAVVRPRDLPLLTSFQSNQGEVHLWTTFSEDQIDLNFANPKILLEILDLILYYIQRGAYIIRLDAIAFLWKEPGSPSIHLPQTHQIIKLMRDVVSAIAPHVLLLTETNVPHEENVSYFGNGQDEAHMVYQFALPPLILHTLTSGDATRLAEWAATLERPSQEVTFFNFTASHDGIGVRPARGILTGQELEALIQLTEERGGNISYRRIGDHDRQAYELNINYFDALSGPEEIEKQPHRAIARFLCSQAIMLCFPGLPAIYFHSLFGSRNDPEAVKRTGHLRAINREKFSLEPFLAKLEQPDSVRYRVFNGYQKLLMARQSHPAFDPWGEHEIIRIQPEILALLRKSPQVDQRLICLHEVSGQERHFNVPLRAEPEVPAQDLLSKEMVDLKSITLEPYQVRWIQLD
jgi:glycosidase